MSQGSQEVHDSNTKTQAVVGQTVMQFTYIEFDDNWSRQFADNYKYALRDDASLLVVAEDSTGTKTIYWYTVKKDDHVWIGGSDGNENLVYIPSICTRAQHGDYSSCGRLLGTV
jgi:hypothetical protein